MNWQKPPLGSQIVRPDTGLVGFWPMNEGSGDRVNDLSGNGNNGTCVGDAHFVDSERGSCLSFDGAGDYVNCGTSLTSQFIALTFSSWLKLGASGGWGGTLFSFVELYGYKPAMFLDYYTEPMLMLSATNSRYWPASATTTLKNGAWHHVVIVLTGYGQGDIEDAQMYIDGVLITPGATVSTSAPIAKDGLVFKIGAAGETYFNGSIDDVMIYDRALSTSEITRLYQDPYWMFRRNRIELWTAASPVGEEPSEYDSVFMGCNF